MGTIKLHNMEFYAYHGFLPEERIIGRLFYVDVAVDADIRKAMETDNLQETINYQLIYDIVKREMLISSELLEHVAGRIIHALKAELLGVNRVAISIRKKNPPLNGKIEYAEIQIIE